MRITKRRLITMITAVIVAIASWILTQFPSVYSEKGVDLEVVATSTSEIVSNQTFDLETDLPVDVDVDPDIETDAAIVQTNATVLHVVDGDTLDADLEGVGKVRIRLLGVNTPETVDPRKPVECFGKAASNFSKKTLAIGSRIALNPDPQADERDKYGRLLRNVVLADGTDYNALLIREGYAYAYLSFPLAPERKVELKRLENEAKSAKRGLWGAKCE